MTEPGEAERIPEKRLRAATEDGGADDEGRRSDATVRFLKIENILNEFLILSE